MSITPAATRLEHEHNFRDPTFSSYMRITTRAGQGPLAFQNMAENMVGHEHPLVQYAAGWAAIEAATISRHQAQKRGWSLENRQESLVFAENTWSQIDASIWQKAIVNRKKKSEGAAWSLTQRHQRAVAYMPAFGLIARTLGSDGEPQEAQSAAIPARSWLPPHLQALIGVLKSSRGDVRHSYAQGLADESVTAWYLQPGHFKRDTSLSDQPNGPPYIVVPASLRDNYNNDNVLRANLLVAPLHSSGRKTPIAVGCSRPSVDLTPKVFHVGADADLYSKGFSALRVLEAINKFERGHLEELPRFIHTASEQLQERFQTRRSKTVA